MIPDEGPQYLLEPFGIDDGSLDRVPSHEAFALGVEWLMWAQCIHDGSVRTGLCLANNGQRIQDMLERHGWFCEARQCGSVGWMQIWVGERTAPLEDEGPPWED